MTEYRIPSDVSDISTLRRQAALRRGALEAHGCSTYERGTRGGQAAIICLCCGLGSAHPKDIAEKYCGFCHQFHTDWSEP